MLLAEEGIATGQVADFPAPSMTDVLPPPSAIVEADVARALAEDLGTGDVTAALLPDIRDTAYVLCKESAVVCGRPWFDACHRALDPEVAIAWHVAEGDRVRAGTVVATLEGRARALVQRRTRGAQFPADAERHGDASPPTTSPPSRGTGAQILDTRKTIPGLRVAQKYAVRVGGGVNHRIGLVRRGDAEGKPRARRGSIDRRDPQRAQATQPALPLIVEVETLDAAATKRCAKAAHAS